MNRIQKRQLVAYLHFRDKEMTVANLILFNWRIFAMTSLIGALTVVGMLLLSTQFFAWIVSAVYAAVILRDLGQCIRWWRVWPMTKEVLDWQSIERLAKENGLAA